MDILPPAISVPRPDFVRTLGAPASVGSIPRLASSVPPSTPKPADRIFATTILARLPGSTAQRASSTGPGNRSEYGAPPWRLDGVPSAKPEAVHAVVLSAPHARRFPQAPSSGSPSLALPRKPLPPRFAKDLSRRPGQLAGEGLLGLLPAASEHPVFPCPHTTTLPLHCHLYYAPISNIGDLTRCCFCLPGISGGTGQGNR